MITRDYAPGFGIGFSYGYPYYGCCGGNWSFSFGIGFGFPGYWYYNPGVWLPWTACTDIRTLTAGGH